MARIFRKEISLTMPGASKVLYRFLKISAKAMTLHAKDVYSFYQLIQCLANKDVSCIFTSYSGFPPATKPIGQAFVGMTESETKMKLKKIKLFVIGFLGSILIRLLIGTIIVEERPSNYAKNFKRQGKNVIYAFWHSFMLVPAYTARNLGIKVLISHHTDGEYIAQVIQRLGHNVVRGSTTRGGVRALLSMIKKVKEEDTSLAITPDGPRGPRFIVQPGVIFLGQKTGYPILPGSLGLTSYWELPSWDRFRIPKPFSRAILMYGDPIMIPPKLDKSKVEEYREVLEKTLNEMTVEAERMVKEM